MDRINFVNNYKKAHNVKENTTPPRSQTHFDEDEKDKDNF